MASLQHPTEKSNTESSDFWNDILTSLKGSMQEATFNHHFLGSKAAIDADGALTILLPPTANIEAIKRGYDKDIHRLVVRTIGERPIAYQAHHPYPTLPEPTPAAERDTSSEFALRMTQDHSAGDIVSFRRSHVRMCKGNVLAAMVLSKMVYWYQPGQDGQSKLRVFKDGYYWIARPLDEWEAEAELTKRQAQRAIDHLVKLGLVIKHHYRFDGFRTMHLRIDQDVYIDLENADLRSRQSNNA